MLLLREALPAVAADVGPLAGVVLAVRHEVPLQREPAPALVAHEWTFPTVHPRMRNKMMFQRKRHLTLVTPIRPLGRVQQQMRIQAVFPRKRLAAMCADMGPFTCMYSSVGSKMVLQKEGFAALVAAVRSLLHRGRGRCRHHRVCVHELRLRIYGFRRIIRRPRLLFRMQQVMLMNRRGLNGLRLGLLCRRFSQTLQPSVQQRMVQLRRINDWRGNPLSL